ncbi:MAG: HNH endonuclease [Lachnospiraceae bacterium]|nr:HNH endonuclease [Lachnospiraceae bacterium]
MVSKSVKRKLLLFWEDKCAVCGKQDYLEFHHLIAKEKGGTDEYDNLIVLCGCCHAAVHGRKYNENKPNCNTSISYEEAKPILEEYFANKIGAKETKDRLKLSQKTHLSESALYKRYKREHSIKDFYNNVDLISSKRRNHVPDTTDVIIE